MSKVSNDLHIIRTAILQAADQIEKHPELHDFYDGTVMVGEGPQMHVDRFGRSWIRNHKPMCALSWIGYFLNHSGIKRSPFQDYWQVAMFLGGGVVCQNEWSDAYFHNRIYGIGRQYTTHADRDTDPVGQIAENLRELAEQY